MRYIKLPLVFVIFILYGCSFDVTVHDEDKAAELTRDNLEQLKTDKGIASVYESSHKKLTDSVSRDQFTTSLKKVRSMLRGNTIAIFAYETYGAQEMISIYANTTNSDKKIFFRLIYMGTMSKGYKLFNFSVNDTGFEKTGLYRKFTNTILVQSKY